MAKISPENLEIARKIIINTIQDMTPEQLEIFIRKQNFDFRLWYRVRINGKLVPWWACEYEIPELKKEYKNIEFEPVSYCEAWSVT